MEIRDANEALGRMGAGADGSKSAQLFPTGSAGGALMALDLFEVAPGSRLPARADAEEHVLYVLSGTGEVSGGAGRGAAILLRADSVVHISARERHEISNTGREPLRLLVCTPLLVRSERALGVHAAVPASPSTSTSASTASTGPRTTQPEQTAQGAPHTPQQQAQGEALPPVQPAPSPAPRPTPVPARIAETRMPAAQSEPVPDEEEEETPLPDISALMKRGSEVQATPRSERRPPTPEPEPEPVPAPPDADAQDGAEEEDAQSNLMELHVVFDGGSRGNPGQGYGSFLVQSPNRKPIVKRREFGDNYTNNQAEYDTLIAALEYIVERLEATGRSPEQVMLDIWTDSDLVVNQLNGSYKVKDAGLKKRNAQAAELLDRFAMWNISWHAREESVRLLGH